MKLRLVFPLSLIIVLFISGCEVPRSGDEPGDISQITPGVTITSALPPSPTAPAVITPTVEGVTPPDVSDISPVGVPASQAPPADAFEPGKVLVKLTEQAAILARQAELADDEIMTSGSSTLDQTLTEIGAREFSPITAEISESTGAEIEIQATGLGQLYSVSFPPENNPVEVAARLEEDPAVEYSEPNYIAGIAAEPAGIPAPLTPNDQYYQYQWNFQLIQMPAAWDMANGANVTVAIVDTGIDFGAPDLANTNRLPGYDFANNDADATDDNGHGTHVAGTVAQSTNNNLGVAGVAYGARLLPVKVLGANGQGSYENIINGITYAVNQGAQVINLSLTGRTGSESLRAAVEYAYSRGVVVVAAAGNSNGPVEYPAAYDEFVIAVGATRFDNTKAPYSNFGPEIDLVAPGGDVDVDQNGDGYGDGVLQNTIRSTGSGYSYRFFEGTSMASPHVAGIAALLLSLNPDASVIEIENAMAQTAQNLDPSDQLGAGLVQAAGAIETNQPTTATATPTHTSTPTLPSPTSTSTIPVTGPTNTPTHTPTVTPTPTGTHTPTLTPSPTLTPTASPTPASTITATPAPPLAGELLVNGGFENENGWVFGDTPIRGGYDTAVVRSGSRAARLGAVSGSARYSFSSVWQRVTIPAEAKQARLDTFVYPVSQSPSSCNNQSIAVLNEHFRVIKFLWQGLSNSQTWESRSYDLAEFRGRTIYVYFSVLNRGCRDDLSAMFVDDVSLTWSP